MSKCFVAQPFDNGEFDKILAAYDIQSLKLPEISVNGTTA